MRAAGRLAALVGFEVSAVLALHALGELPWLRLPLADVPAWLAVTSAEDAVAAAARLAALACAYWLLLSTVVYTVAVATRLPGAVRAVEWTTLPAVRRVADHAIAVALVTSSVVASSPALGAAGATPRATGDAGAEPTATAEPVAGPVPPPAAPRPHVLPDAPPRDRGDVAPSERGAASADAEGPVDYVVEPGDSLWSITAAHLAAAGAPTDDAAVFAQWVAVVEANRDGLRSGDPDLVFPGETVTLSPLPSPEAATEAG